MTVTTGIVRRALLGATIAIMLAPSLASAQGMSANEAKGTAISGKWRGSRGLVTKGADGKIIFLFGEVQPSVVCSPLQV